jgi:predicted transcriptional regulator
MRSVKFSQLELQVLEAFWQLGKASIREIQESFPEPRPAYTTIQTMVYRLEQKDALRRTRKISNAHIFEPTVDRILSLFGGRAQPMVAQLAEAGKLSLEDVRELEKIIRKRDRQQTGKPRRTK